MGKAGRLFYDTDVKKLGPSLGFAAKKYFLAGVNDLNKGPTRVLC